MRNSIWPARRRQFALVIGLAALTACENPSAPDPGSRVITNAITLAAQSSLGGSGTLPFTYNADFNSLAGSPSVTCSPNGAGMAYTVGAREYVGEGPASHMGMTRMTVTFASCVTVFQPEGDDLLVFTTTGPVTMVGANGDEIHGAFTMKQYASGRFAVEAATISGGTGRFANASGELSAEGWINRETHIGYVMMTGTISRPNS